MYLHNLGIVCSLGHDRPSVLNNLLQAQPPPLAPVPGLSSTIPALSVPGNLPPVPVSLCDYDCRNNRLLLAALGQIEDSLAALVKRVGPQRTGIVIGSSTSGIAEGERAVAGWQASGHMPNGYHYRQQALGGPAEFLARYLDIRGPAFSVSTTCSSSANAMAAARRLIRTGSCDVVLTGGADALCDTTLQGFAALEAISKTRCNPFSRNRDGITLGEGAALLLMSREPFPIALLGVGATSDAWHISAPDPEGDGAFAAMRHALQDAHLRPERVDYLNLHGTGTRQNDAMENRAIHRLFDEPVPCSASKPLTGHCLGAAGAIEAGLCWLLLSELNFDNGFPPHLWDGAADPELAPLPFVKPGNWPAKSLQYCLSNSFAFGGNNVSLLIGRI